jgi:hypothetical protein
MVSLSNRQGTKKNIVLWEKLRLDGIAWHRKQGLNFKALNKKVSQKLG